eukprot:COSAG01_NODE_3956_length_5496_cov_105.592737_3_plen_96_part_00
MCGDYLSLIQIVDRLRRVCAATRSAGRAPAQRVAHAARSAGASIWSWGGGGRQLLRTAVRTGVLDLTVRILRDQEFLLRSDPILFPVKIAMSIQF